MVVGILALQGAVEPHVEKLQSLGATVLRVKRPADLEKVDRIILPGGESTTMIHLLKLNNLWGPLQNFVRTRPTLGVCAGAILLASEVTNPKQESLSAIDIAVERNAYGPQTESFEAPLEPTSDWISKEKVSGVFIRAPQITRVGASVRVLLTHSQRPVLIESNNVLVGTFHPELTDSPLVHDYFLKHGL